jgi:SAM-dependent methyltransferase
MAAAAVDRAGRCARSSGVSLVRMQEQEAAVPDPLVGEGYRRSHALPEHAAHYDVSVYGPETYDAWIWDAERAFVISAVRRYAPPHPSRYLDFACGTGRLLSALESYVAEARGVDISPAMLAVARRRVVKATLLCGDPTLDSSVVGEPHDVATAFRFFLNAEQPLREEAVKVLWAALKPDGLLIVNTHGNTWSLRTPSAIIRRYLLRQREVNVLSYARLERLLTDVGFAIVERRGFGFLPRRVAGPLGRQTFYRLESFLTRVGLGRFATTVVLVARRPRE